MDQRPHTESEAVEREPNQSDTTEEQQEVSEDVGIGQTSKRSSHKTRRIGIIVSAIVIAAAAISVFALTYCPHEWAEANCSSPKTCLKCGKTEGEPLGDEGHVWDSATCTEPKTCSRCGATEGKSLKDETDDLIADLKQDLKRSGEHKRYSITIRPS